MSVSDAPSPPVPLRLLGDLKGFIKYTIDKFKVR